MKRAVRRRREVRTKKEVNAVHTERLQTTDWRNVTTPTRARRYVYRTCGSPLGHVTYRLKNQPDFLAFLGGLKLVKKAVQINIQYSWPFTFSPRAKTGQLHNKQNLERKINCFLRAVNYDKINLFVTPPPPPPHPPM